jgi:hypothetical protein
MNDNVDDFTPTRCQVAFSVVDLRATERWYREGLCFLPAGESRRLIRTPLTFLSSTHTLDTARKYTTADLAERQL